MKKIIFTSMLMMVGAAIYAQYNSKNLSMESSVSANKYHFKNLQLYPIRGNSSFFNEIKDNGNYLSLKEGLESKRILITEKMDTSSRIRPGGRDNRFSGINSNNEIQQQQYVSEGTVNTLF